MRGGGTVRVRVRDANLPLRLAPSSTAHLGEAEQPSRLAQGRLALGTEATLALSAGRPLLALEYMQSDSLEIRRDFEATLDALRRGDISAVDAAQKCHKQNADIMLGCFMDYLHRIATGELKDNPNPWLFDFSDKLRTARSWVLSGSNPNLQLLWEELFMDWLQVFRRRR